MDMKVIVGLMVFLSVIGKMHSEILISTKSDKSSEEFIVRDKILQNDLVNAGTATLDRAISKLAGETFHSENLNDGTGADTNWSSNRSLETMFWLKTREGGNSSGYDISEIRVFTGSPKKNAFIFQDYSIWYHRVGDHMAEWYPFAENVILSGTERGRTTSKDMGGGQETTIKNTAGMLLATNVDAIRFDYSRHVLKNGKDTDTLFSSETSGEGTASSIFQELDVLGIPSKPIIQADKRQENVKLGKNAPPFFFAPDSFWNTPIPPGTPTHPDSDRIITLLQGVQNRFDQKGLSINTSQWTIPVYMTSPDVKVVDVQCSYSPLGTKTIMRIPIPEGVLSDAKMDGHLTIVDPVSRTVWDLIRARFKDGQWSCYSAVSYDLDGSGIFNPKHYPAEKIRAIETANQKMTTTVQVYGSGRGPGVPSPAGLILYEEIRNGYIPHKLALATLVNDNQLYVYPPAVWTDGILKPSAQEVFGLPEGAQIQLDPNLDLDQFKLTPAARAIAKALQVYGAVNMDYAGAVTLYAEGLYGHKDKSWDGLLWTKIISDIGLEHFRVLKTGTTLTRAPHSTPEKEK